MLASSYPILDAFLTMLYFFLFIIWIWLLIMVFSDIFRSHDMGGGAKALWVIFVIVMPYLGVFVYLIARGGKMHERAAAAGGGAAEGIRLLRQAGGRHEQRLHGRPAVQAGRPEVPGRDHRRRVRRAEGKGVGQLSQLSTIDKHTPTREEVAMTLGPVSYTVVAFPGNRFNGNIAPEVEKLVSNGTVRDPRPGVRRQGRGG